MITNLRPRLFLSCLGVLAMAHEGRGQDVAGLIQQLGSPQYQARERAFRLLQAEVHRQDVFEQLRGPFPDPEVDARAAQLREQYVRRIKPTNLPTLPWIDMLPPTGHPKAQQIVSEYLARSGGHGRAPLWTGDQEATGMWVRDLVNQGVPRDQILAVLDAMGEVQRQSVWYKDYVKALGK